MAATKHSTNYRRRGATGTLSLSGVVDIFEAGPLHAAALKAAADAQANELRLDLTEVERLDVTALQVVLATRRDVEASGKTVSVTPPGARVVEHLAKVGITL